mgnify:CR=1 FL=1
MSITDRAASKIGAEAREATAQAAPWIERLARFGYAAKGVVYIVVGYLAFEASRGDGEATDSGGALQTIVSQPFGKALLWLIATGLVGYTVWRFVAAGLNPERKGGPKRLGYAVSGLIHAGLSLEAFRLATGSGGGQSGEQQADHWTAQAMSHPMGKWAVAAVGIGIAIFGIQQLIHAWRVKLDDQLALGRLSAQTRHWVIRVGRAGLAARGVVFSLVGIYLVLAALRSNPSEARGVGGALQTLQEQSFGSLLLALVAIGLISYGIYELVRARYRRIRAT